MNPASDPREHPVLITIVHPVPMSEELSGDLRRQTFPYWEVKSPEQASLASGQQCVLRIESDRIHDPTALERWFWQWWRLREDAQWQRPLTPEEMEESRGPVRIEYAPVPEDLPSFPPRPSELPRILMLLPKMEIGGADKFNLDLVRLLTEDHGWDITAVTTLESENRWHGEFAKFIPEIFHLPEFLPVQDWPRFLRSLLESRRPDLVFISHSEFGYQLLPFLRACAPRCKFVDYVHIVEERWRSGGFPRYSVVNRELLDRTFASSEALKSWMIDAGGDPEKIDVVYTGVSLPGKQWDLDSLREKWGVASGVDVILFPARLSEQKRPLLCISVLARLAETGRAFLCLSAGDGPMAAETEEALREAGLEERVRLLGGRSLDEMQELLALSAVCFLPSQEEGISLAFYESMAAGVVPVGADVGGQRELVTPDCGILVPPGPGEEEMYSKALDRLLSDPEKRAAMGEAARARVEREFPLHRMGEAMNTGLRAEIQKEPGEQWDLRIGWAIAAEVVDKVELRARSAEQVLAFQRELKEQWAELERVGREWKSLGQQCDQLFQENARLHNECGDNWKKYQAAEEELQHLKSQAATDAVRLRKLEKNLSKETRRTEKLMVSKAALQHLEKQPVVKILKKLGLVKVAPPVVDSRAISDE